MSFRVQVFDNFRDVRPLWKRFEAETTQRVFQTFDLQQHFHATCGEPRGIRPCLVYVEGDDGWPLALLPLQLRVHYRVRLLEWLGGFLFDYRGPLLASDFAERCGEDDFSEIWRQICRSLPAFDAVDFKRMPDIIGGVANPFVRLPGAAVTNYCFQARLADDWERFYAACVGAKARSTQRRKERKLAALGALHFDVLTDVGDPRRQIDTLLALKSQRYELFGKVANDERAVQFLNGLVGDPSLSHMTHFSVLRLDDTIIAAHLGFVHDRTFYYMIPAFETDRFGVYSPGNILLLRLMQWAIENDYEVFDFTMGQEAYKMIWSDSFVTLYDYSRPMTLRGSAFIATRNLQRRVKGWGPKPLAEKFAVGAARDGGVGPSAPPK